jgi:hypothetical protein
MKVPVALSSALISQYLVVKRKKACLSDIGKIVKCIDNDMMNLLGTIQYYLY